MCVKPVSAAFLLAASHAVALALALKEKAGESEDLTVRTRSGNWRVVVHVLPAEKPDRPLSECALDILHVLEGRDIRLTTTRIMHELDKESLLWGESTVKHTLAHLVRRGLIASSRQAPRGYWLLDEHDSPCTN